MRNLRYRTLAFTALFSTIVVCFQNCDGGFVVNKRTGELSSLGAATSIPSTINDTGPYMLVTYSPSGATIADGVVIDTAMDYVLMASGTGVKSAILTWSFAPGQNTAGCTLGSTGSNYSKILRCLSTGAVQVRAEAIWSDGTSSVASVSRTVQVGSVNPGGGPTNPNVVEFRIRTGTGTGAWNMVGSPAVAFVGQTLKIINDDTVNHQLRTPGTPCATQAAPMAPNGFYDCALTATHSPTATDLYDQIAGTNATFYLNVIDGTAQYNRVINGQSCASCHNAIATSAKRGATFTVIKSAITRNVGGMGIYNGMMSDDEIRAIAYRLR